MRKNTDSQRLSVANSVPNYQQLVDSNIRSSFVFCFKLSIMAKVLVWQTEEATEPTVAQLLSATAEDLYQVEVFHDGEALTKHLAQNGEALVVVDERGAAHTASIEELHLSGIARSYPVVVITDKIEANYRLEIIKQGAQDVLDTEGLNTELLARSLRYAAERHYLRHKNHKIAHELEVKREELIEAQAIAQVGQWTFKPFYETMMWSYEAINVLNVEEWSEQTPIEQFLELVFYRDRDKLKESLRMAVEENTDFSIDLRLKQLDKKFQHVNLRIRSADNNTPLEEKSIKGTIQDITLRKETERALKRSEEKYHALFDQSKDAIYITTREGQFIDFNEATLSLFGYTEEEMKQINVEGIYLNPFERVRFKKAIDEEGFVKDFEIKLKRSNGEKIDCIITSSKWQSNNKKLLGFQGIIRDITEVKQNADLRKEKEVIERSANMKEQFLANMSHEIRTPINGISGLTHLLLKTELETKQMEYVRGIRSSSDHLLALINDILDFSKIEAGKITFESVNFRLRDHLEQMLMPLRVKASERGNELLLDVGDLVPEHLVGDPIRLRQILLNLLSNSVKFTENGKVILTIKQIEANKDAAVLSFCVRDTGIGIPANKLEAIFSSFTQVAQDLNKMAEGTGLGLAITKQLVDLQGGTIRVKSEQGIGTEFAVTLKFRSMVKTKEEKAQEDDFEIVDIGRKRILLVEDKKLNQLVANEMLVKWWGNITVDIAEDGQIAVQKFAKHNYDLVLMDVQMPVMDGYQATRTIRNQFRPPESEVPILAMTAYATTGEAEKCLDAGMNDYISKPFEPIQFYQKVLSLLGHSEAKSGELLQREDIQQISFEQESIDLDTLDKITGGNEKLRSQIITLMLDETPEEMVKLMEYIDDKNWNRTRSMAHKMKSSISYLGLSNTLNIIKRIEEYAGEQKNLDNIPKLAEQVAHTVEKALEELAEVPINS